MGDFVPGCTEGAGLKRRPKTPEQRTAEQERENFRSLWLRCWACGKIAPTKYWDNQIHELIRRSETKHALDERNYCYICPSCHGQAHGGWLTKGVLMSLKMLLDPTRYQPDWLRANGVFKGIEPEPLPLECEWIFSYDAKQERRPA